MVLEVGLVLRFARNTSTWNVWDFVREAIGPDFFLIPDEGFLIRGIEAVSGCYRSMQVNEFRLR